MANGVTPLAPFARLFPFSFAATARFVAALVWVLLLLSPGAKADEAEDFEICSGRRSVPVAEQLRVCDRLVDSNISLQKKALAYCNRSIAHRMNGNQAEAMKDVEAAISLNSDPYTGLTCRAFQYDIAGDLDHAIADYDRAIAFDPRRHQAFIARGHIYMKKKEPVRALEDYKKATSLDPTSSLAFSSRGYAEFQLRQFDEAIESFTAAIRLDPKRFAAYDGRGSAYKAKGDEDHARSDFAEALRIKTGH